MNHEFMGALLAFKFLEDSAKKKIQVATNLFITLQATKDLNDIFDRCRFGDLVFRVPPFVPLHEERQSPDNDSFAVRDKTGLEVVDYIEKT